MARGESGRIVVEVEPDLKAELYVALARENLTLKAWFIREAQRYVKGSRQLALFVAEPEGVEYDAAAESGAVASQPREQRER